MFKRFAPSSSRHQVLQTELSEMILLIPGVQANAAGEKIFPLTDGTLLTPVTIKRISSETPTALKHLVTLGLLPNVEIVIENKAPFGGPVMIRVGRAHYALGHNLAARIWVHTR